MISTKPLPTKIHPLKQRAPSAKHMTIVFGVLQSNSIVFAADTEETGVFLKLDTPKLYSYSRSNGESLVIGGAGLPFSVDTLQQRLGRSFIADSDSFEDTAEALIKQFHNEYVGDQTDRDFWLILGFSLRIAEGKYDHRLLISENGGLRNSGGIATIGIGMEIARNLLKRYAILAPIPIPELSAVHVLRHVKEQAQYCGRDSMVWCLCGPDVFMMSSSHIQRAEELSRRYDELTNNLFSALFAKETALPYIDSKLRGLRADYARVVDELKSRYANEREISEHFRSDPEAH